MSQLFKDSISHDLWKLSQTTWGNNTDGAAMVQSRGSHTSTRYRVLPSGNLFGMSAEGVGTKIEFAERLGMWSTLGLDLLAMILDDVARIGAEALGLTLTLDIGEHSGGDRVKTLLLVFMEGIVNYLSSISIPLLDGEFSELGSHIDGYGPLPLIANAAASWVVEKEKLVDGFGVKKGDTIIALPEIGFRSNGYTFLREILQKAYYSEAGWMDATLHIAGKELQVRDLVMCPSQIYYPIIRKLRTEHPTIPISGMVHITGGGVPGKLGKYVRKSNTSAIIHTPMLCMSPLIQFFLEKGHVLLRDALEHWNMGYGFLLITPEPDQVLEVLCKDESNFPVFIPQVVGSIDESRGCSVVMTVSSTLGFV